MDYMDFLQTKKLKFKATGFDCDPTNEYLFDFQKAIVKWAIKKGRCALFLDTGLGKTLCQLSWADEIYKKEKQNILILCPLAVAIQTQQEGEKFGIKVNICRNQEDVKDGINITNYEMLQHFDTDKFIAVVLDESSILKSYSGKVKNMLVDKFKNTKYKLSCTATPSPNDTLELLNQSEFLGVMKSNEALTMWFIADQKGMGDRKLRLKKHAESNFWEFVSNWAVFIRNPKDLGFDGSRYILPKLNEIDIILNISLESNKKGELIRTIQKSATNYHKEKKIITPQRIEKIAEIVNNSTEQFLVWCDTNEESTLLKKALIGSVEVKGSDSTQHKEQSANNFRNGNIRVLISKAKIFGYGLNFQNCNNCVFCGLNYSYESYYQAVRRLYRFGQTKEVNVYRVMGHTERHILQTINTKYQKQMETHEGVNKSANKLILEELYNTNFEISEQKTDLINIPKWIKGDE